MQLGRISQGISRARRPQLHKRLGWQSAWQVLTHFVSRQISAGKACEYLGVGRSRLYELRQKFLDKPQDQEPSKDWFYQRTVSESKIPGVVRGYLEEELKYLKEESPYFKGHFNFAVLSQQCHQRFGKRMHRNTVRRYAIREGFFNPKTDHTGKPHLRFEMGAVGMLFQHDSSIHVWLPLTQRLDTLILTIDDHSRKVVGGLLVPKDTAWHHLCVLRQTFETYGCPLAYYTDNHIIFRNQTETHTQFSRALAAFHITLKFSEKAQPQARGKVEKRFDYFQRRIPYLCERYKITSLTQANKVLQQEITYFNQYHIHDETGEIPDKRWQKAVLEGRTYLKPIPERTPLDLIFALHYPRALKKDGTLAFGGKLWQIPNAPRYGLVTVVLKPPTTRRPLTEISVVYKGSTLAHFVLSKTQPPSST